MNIYEELDRLADAARREPVPAYATDLCEDVWARLRRQERGSQEFTITGLCFAVASSAAAVVLWLYSGGAADATGLETIFREYDPLNTLAALGGI